MKVSSRFTVAVHMLLFLGVFGEKSKATSEFIAGSVGVNPVIIRRILGLLKGAGLVKVARGSGGAKLAKEPAKISLLDVYRAADCGQESIFRFHENPNPACPVGRAVHEVLDESLAAAQQALEGELERVTLAQLLQDMEKGV